MATITETHLKLFFKTAGERESPVTTQALANAVLEEFDKSTYPLDTLADVEKMILAEHTAPIQKHETKGHSIFSEIKVHCRKPIHWTPKTGEEMGALFKHRVEGDVLQIHAVEADDNYVDLCPTSNPGVWMKLKMRQEFEDFNKKNPPVSA